MVLDPIPQPLPVHFFGSRPQPPTSHLEWFHILSGVASYMYIYIYVWIYMYIYTAGTDYESTVEWLYIFVHSQVISYPQWNGFICMYIYICMNIHIYIYSGYWWWVHCEVDIYIHPLWTDCISTVEWLHIYIYIYIYINIHIYRQRVQIMNPLWSGYIYSSTLKWLQIRSGVASYIYIYICMHIHIYLYSGYWLWIHCGVATYIHALWSDFISTVEWLYMYVWV